MKNILRFLIVTATAAILVLPASAAEPKRVIVCTVTTGFRHSSIPYAEKTLQKLADETHLYTIVDFARQPDVQIAHKPNKPGDLKPDADDKAKARYDADMKRYNNIGFADKITCPSYVTDNDKDEVSPGQGKILFDHLTGLKADSKEFRLFTAAEGAEGHCEGMAPIVFWDAAFNWLDALLAS